MKRCIRCLVLSVVVLMAACTQQPSADDAAMDDAMAALDAAGRVDAGRDAAASDSSSPDVGPQDAGTDDAGPCATDSACGAGMYCDAGTCRATKANGARCTVSNECTSASCADGVCCDRACDGLCEACTGAIRGAGFDGECGPIASGSDPASECANEDPSTCGTTGVCDGAGACALWPTGTSCGDAACAAGVAQPARTCDGAGTCADVGTSSCSPFACGTSACLTTCTTDSDCDPTAFCDTGTCVSHRVDGSACARSNDCASGFCVDGVCCGSACTGTCMACASTLTGGVNGICAATAVGTDPDAECAASSMSSCGTDGVCDGVGACRLWAAGTTCGGASCTAGTQHAVSQCDGASNCTAGASSSCGPYACAGSSCGVSCASDVDCAAGNYCASSSCVPKLANGVTCSAATQCTSGSCVDGVCCDTACAGTCMACAAVLTGGTNGTCAVIAAGADPQNECAASAASSCGLDGSCNGTGGCRLWPAGTTCAAQSCTSGAQANTDTCDGAGTCVDGGTTTCTPYACAGSSCGVSCASDVDCAAGNYCASSSCVPKLANGVTCSTATQCTSGSCVDGVCCDTACAGTCMACAAVLTGGTNGTCAVIAAGADPQNECAASAASSCGLDGSCNGTGGCRLWPAGTTCAAQSCTSGAQANTDTCDGAGTCVDGGTTTCDPYTCSGSSCGTSCSSDTDCVASHYCATGTCVMRQPNQYSLDALGGYATIGDFDFVGDLTVMVWVRPTDYGAVISKYGFGGGFEININASMHQVVLHTQTDSSTTTLRSPAPIPLNVWTHIAVTLTATGSAVMYVNGTNVAAADLSPPVDTADPVYFARSTWGGNPLPGQVDEIAVYGRVLTSSEIASRMTRRLDVARESSLRGYWPFEEGSGTTSANAVGASFTAAFVAPLDFSTSVPFP